MKIIKLIIIFNLLFISFFEYIETINCFNNIHDSNVVYINEQENNDNCLCTKEYEVDQTIYTLQNGLFIGGVFILLVLMIVWGIKKDK